MRRTKNTSTHRVCTYRGHAIYFNTQDCYYRVALRYDGTDDYFKDLDAAYLAIDVYEDRRSRIC